MNKTIPEIAAYAAQHWPDGIAIQDDGLTISFKGLQARAEQAGAAMVASGLNAGDRFAIWAPNIHQWVWMALGGLMAGAILVPLNTRYKGIEAGDILRRSGSRLLFTTCGFLDTDYPALLAEQSLPGLEETILLRGDSQSATALDDFLNRATADSKASLAMRCKALSSDSVSDILYTSGTTGAPKGVVSSHGQTVSIFDTWSSTVGLCKNDRYLVVNPFFHSFGYKAGWLSALIKGATILPMAVYDAEQTLHIVEQYSISMLPGAPTIFQTLLASARLADTDTSSLRCAVTGAASVPEQLVYDMKNVLGFDEVFTAYGLTECPVVSITQPGDEISRIANTAGKAIANTQIRVVDADHRERPTGEVGAIHVRGFNVMQGYFADESASAETITTDGWLITGDLGWQDEYGYLKVTDREKDMFICGGFNCYPAEIENLLLRHEDIHDVAVVGISDQRLGEVGHAYIVTDNTDLDHQQLSDWCREHMANYKVPRRFTRINTLPRNASGKVQKFLLADLDT